jgi:type IV secretion system protein VirD4
VPDRGREMIALMSSPRGWGPSHQTQGQEKLVTGVLDAAGLVGFFLLLALPFAVGVAILSAVVVARIGWSFRCERRAKRLAAGTGAAVSLHSAVDPLRAVLEHAVDTPGDVYLGLDQRGDWVMSRSERAVMVLGPPRSGKTSAVIAPALSCHLGPAVCTSTKPDVAALTRAARGRYGRLWVFDPTAAGVPDGFAALRWSPVTSARSWEQALLTARAMTATVGAGTTQGSHWANRAQALLAPLLHAAALDSRDMETVADWVMRHDLNQAGIILEHQTASRLAFGSLVGIFNTEPRERASIFSAAADALLAYNSEAALDAAKNPNFDPAQFVASTDTVYILAPAEQQAAAAPIVCGLLSEIRRATYHTQRNGRLRGRMLFALDEAANIAPLDELPAIASEGGGQGLTLLAAFQDLSQARQRWGQAADGFLTLFGTKLIFPGISDSKTLETVSVGLGEYDRRVVSRTSASGGFWQALSGQSTPAPSTTVSTQRTRVLSAGEIANIPQGRALYLDGVAWELLTPTPAYSVEPWKTLTAPETS